MLGILYAAWIAQLLPVALALRGRALTPARRWVIAWSLVLFVADGISLLVGRRMGNNLWLAYVTPPVEDAFLLWALSHWQRDAISRLAYRIAIPLLVAVWILLVLTLENTNTFGVVAHPFRALVMLMAALVTLVRGSLAESDRLTRRDWFWVGLGLTLYFALGTALHPFARIFIADRPDLVLLAYNTKALTDVLAFLLIAVGIACPLPQTRSGGSSSPRRSPWRSSFSPSAPPS